MSEPTNKPANTDSSEGIRLVVDLKTGKACESKEITLAALGLTERADLQRWVTEYPRLIGEDLLLVTTEFDQWEIRSQKVSDRLDVLFLDTTGCLVIAELKRDQASDTVELQALKYAAYCSQLTLDDLIEEFARYHGVGSDEARSRLLNHAPRLEDGELGDVRIRLAAGGFGPAVTSVVLWLRDHDIDIGCVQVTAHSIGSDAAVLSSQQLIPLPEAEDYLVRRRRKEQEEEQHREQTEWTWEMYEEHVPPERLAIARELFQRLEQVVVERGLPWTPKLRSGWLGFQRAGEYYVSAIDLTRVVRFSVKVPDGPNRLGLANPYPGLESRWDERNRQWGWEIPSLELVPDVALALDLAIPFQPATGPMPFPERTTGGAASQ